MGIEQFLLIALLNVTATEIGGNTLFKGKDKRMLSVVAGAALAVVGAATGWLTGWSEAILWSVPNIITAQVAKDKILDPIVNALKSKKSE